MHDYEYFIKAVSSNVKKTRMLHNKTVEEVAIDALGHSSAAFYSQAENLKNGKHFNLRHLYMLSRYFECSIDDFFV